ncbi:MAG: hypothetical protein WKF80_11005 [Thermomicrobiales bacterium]
MGDTGWEIVFAIAMVGIVGAVIVFVVGLASKAWQPRVGTNAAIAGDPASQAVTLLEDVAAAQRDVSDRQRTMIEELAQVRQRLTAIEALLREVG